MNAQIFSSYENQWVATDKLQKKVLAANKTLERLQGELKKSKIKDAIVMFIPGFNNTLAPQCH